MVSSIRVRQTLSGALQRLCTTDFDTFLHYHYRLLSLELGSAQTRSWRTASTGFAELRKAGRNSAKPFEAVRQDRVWAEPSSRAFPWGSRYDDHIRF